MDSLKLEYVHRELLAGLKTIYQEQLNIAVTGIRRVGASHRLVRNQRRIGIRTGNLVNSLSQPGYTLSKSGRGNSAIMKYPMYIRFLDMKEHGNHMIYNRQIWGILYGTVFPNIRYGFTSEVRELIDSEIRSIMGEVGSVSG